MICFIGFGQIIANCHWWCSSSGGEGSGCGGGCESIVIYRFVYITTIENDFVTVAETIFVCVHISLICIYLLLFTGWLLMAKMIKMLLMLFLLQLQWRSVVRQPPYPMINICTFFMANHYTIRYQYNHDCNTSQVVTRILIHTLDATVAYQFKWKRDWACEERIEKWMSFGKYKKIHNWIRLRQSNYLHTRCDRQLNRNYSARSDRMLFIAVEIVFLSALCRKTISRS